MMGLGKGGLRLKIWPFLVSMLDFWGVNFREGYDCTWQWHHYFEEFHRRPRPQQGTHGFTTRCTGGHSAGAPRRGG